MRESANAGSSPQDVALLRDREANTALVRRVYEECLNHGNLALLDELIDERLVDHSLFGGGTGHESFKQRFRAVRSAFPDAIMTIEDSIAVGDKVACRWTLHATHTGPFGAVAPTGRHVVVSGMNICRVRSGKVGEHWANFDHLGLLQQLGVMTPRGTQPSTGA